MSDDRKGETANDARPAKFWWSAEKLHGQIQAEALQRRIAREKAAYERGGPIVAGHDPSHGRGR